MSVSIKKYEAALSDQWNDFVSHADGGHFFFNRNFMEYHADRFVDHSLIFYKGEEIIALLPANLVDNILYSHQGLTFGGLLSNGLGAKDTLLCFTELSVYGADLGFSEIRYKSLPSIYRTKSEADIYALFNSGFELYRRDVGTIVRVQEPYKLRADKRRNFNKGTRLGLQITIEKDFSTFWSIVTDMLEKVHQKKPTHSLAEIQLLSERFPENIVHTLLSDTEGSPLGGAVLFINRDVVHVQYMNINAAGRKNGALDYLIVELMKRYSESHTFFSFGISTEEQGRILNEGLSSQKEGFGGVSMVHDFYSKKLS